MSSLHFANVCCFVSRFNINSISYDLKHRQIKCMRIHSGLVCFLFSLILVAWFASVAFLVFIQNVGNFEIIHFERHSVHLSANRKIKFVWMFWTRIDEHKYAWRALWKCFRFSDIVARTLLCILFQTFVALFGKPIFARSFNSATKFMTIIIFTCALSKLTDTRDIALYA